MSQNISDKIESKINEDLSPAKNLSPYLITSYTKPLACCQALPFGAYIELNPSFILLVLDVPVVTFSPFWFSIIIQTPTSCIHYSSITKTFDKKDNTILLKVIPNVS